MALVAQYLTLILNVAISDADSPILLDQESLESVLAITIGDEMNIVEGEKKIQLRLWMQSQPNFMLHTQRAVIAHDKVRKDNDRTPIARAEAEQPSAAGGIVGPAKITLEPTRDLEDRKRLGDDLATAHQQRAQLADETAAPTAVDTAPTDEADSTQCQP